MTDALLPHYNRELAYIRRLASEFALANPGVAEHLRISQGRIDDPHVSRLIEAFAYLNARTRQKIDDDFPEIAEAFLDVLYPHLLAPVPPTAILQFALDEGQAELTDGYTIERGTSIITDSVDGERCRFRTCYSVTLWPIHVAEAALGGPGTPAPQVDVLGTKSVLRIVLQSYAHDIAVRDVQLGPLRFYLHGHPPYMNELYELLLNETLGIAVASSPTATDAVRLPADFLQPVGFGLDETLVDYDARTFAGYRLLNDFFVLPEKYMFVELAPLPRRVLKRLGQEDRLELYFFLNRESRELERNVSHDTFRLGCTPIVNLFRHRAEPIRLNHSQVEYRVVPDERMPEHYEVFSIDRVVATSSQDEEVEYFPFYSINHARQEGETRRFWYAARRPAAGILSPHDQGTELYLSVVDLDFQPAAADEWTLAIETTCLNRDIPSRFDFGGGKPRMQLETGGPLQELRCLTPPTPTRRPDLGHGARWRLVSHLALNHLPLVGGEDGAEALREILRLYNPSGSAEIHAMIDGILRVSSRRVVGRVGGSVSAGFCRGIEVTLEFDEEKYSTHGLFLFATLLDRFLGLSASINSFTKTVAVSNRRESPVRIWPPRAGEQVLL